ncbi:hypothetical protein KORDIASMS9_00964 [Kordia sp. SMS9]|uniref:hypothetical protein n=1 Tax=Kordia sp. SMS9 TaxID=2282170 RepID=UPI000E0D010D|nr:hypothetical protein [Kordia sp. SMS9]AXG68748.1 hypothetical protein KORDIASMS9_00964 [Kordia sp. SMS9]
MKKKNLKTLSLKKSSISNLNGGGPVPIPLTIKGTLCDFTIDINTQCPTTMISELYTACTCQPTDGFDCESFNFPCK